MASSSFAQTVARWQRRHGRHDLPWQRDCDPYRVWLSEIMLQQTQVARVVDYYENFLRRFPTVSALARAKPASVMAAWSGLGYYARARNLHAAARLMARDGFPQCAQEWQALPGVGKSTAASISVFTSGERCAILDGNVKRLLARVYMLPHPINARDSQPHLWALAESLLPPARDIRPYTQGLMDLGATRCHRAAPDCAACPLKSRCLSYKNGAVEEYPKRTASKGKPTKAARFALARSGDKVLLQLRPPRGIWGGLWAPPLLDDDGWRAGVGGDGKAAGGKAKKAGELSFTCEFTHYRLRAKVSAFNVATPGAVKMPLKWHRRLNNIALPAPIKTLLERIDE